MTNSRAYSFLPSAEVSSNPEDLPIAFICIGSYPFPFSRYGLTEQKWKENDPNLGRNAAKRMKNIRLY
ncbi:hypothetical protein TNCT_84961 [Trichonephila clavata]|uniref:Uncharacterized protein n=1 Tax=Trichonephila clavata TaxID=2740835 RepID=A0A8X6KYE4_TRICU|nr:hypothetical protein TNCT_84961 [Trichonephila clavata]